MQAKGYIRGYEDGTFKPEKEVTREEFAQMMYNILNPRKADASTLLNYYDVPESRWSYDPVQVFGSSLKETADGYVYFYPERPITREEVAKLLSDFYKIRGMFKEVNVNSVDGEVAKNELIVKRGLVDADEINENYVEAVNNMYEEGLMKGMSDTEFSPKSSLTRAQAATLLSRINEQVGPQPAETTEDLDFTILKLENKKKNMIYSPLSIEYAMSMLRDGANNNTKSEIDRLLGNKSLTKSRRR